jgi:thiol-disulfide isomerase/thioredoxin
VNPSRQRPHVSQRPLATLAGGLALALVLTACGSTDEAEPTGAATDPATSSAPETAEAPDAPAEVPAEVPAEGGDDPDEGAAPPAQVEVPEALDFTATTVAGESFDGASVAGRPVVLWFWAPWCAVCRSQVPTVTDLAATYGEDVAFVGVGGLDSSDAIRSFADEVGGLTHLSDPDGALYQRFGISEQSSFVVLDAEGGEALRTGYSDDDALSGVVADLAG